MRKSDVLFLQSVLGALIAVNLKNSLRQLADPYYLWKKSKLDCVGIGGASGYPLQAPGSLLQPHSPISSFCPGSLCSAAPSSQNQLPRAQGLA